MKKSNSRRVRSGGRSSSRRSSELDGRGFSRPAPPWRKSDGSKPGSRGLLRPYEPNRDWMLRELRALALDCAQSAVLSRQARLQLRPRDGSLGAQHGQTVLDPPLPCRGPNSKRRRSSTVRRSPSGGWYTREETLIARNAPVTTIIEGSTPASSRSAIRPSGEGASFPRGTSMRSCRILLVDDHSLLLGIVNQLLAEISDIEIVALTREGLEAMSLAVRHQPDLVVTNLAVPRLDGLELTRRLAAEPRGSRIVLMSSRDEPEYRVATDAAGADGFVLEADLGTKLVPLIQSLMEP